MGSARQRILWPANGLNLQAPGSLQPPFTTRDAVNVRTEEPGKGHMRGGVRSGYSKLIPTSLGAPVQALSRVVQDIPRWKLKQNGLSDAFPVENLWGSNPAPGETAFAVVPDKNGDAYVLTASGSIFLVSQKDGATIASYSIPGNGTLLVMAPAIALDETGALYVAGAENADYEGTVWRLRRLPKRQGFLDLDWEVAVVGRPRNLAVRDGVLFLLAQTNAAAVELQKYTSVLKFEPVKRWSKAVQYPADMLAAGKGGTCYVASYSTPPQINKFRADGEISWNFTGSGVGMGIALDEEWGVYSMGKKNGGSQVVARKLIDRGPSVSTSEGTKATATLTATASLPVDGSFVQVGPYIYTYRTVVSTTAYEVLIEATSDLSIDNLIAAVNHASAPGKYGTETPLNLLFGASETAPGIMLATARTAGLDANEEAVSTSIPGATWSSGFLVGGVDGDGAWTFTSTDDPYTNPTQILVDPLGVDLFLSLKSSVWTQSLQKLDGANGLEHFRVALTDSTAQECFGVAFHARDPQARTPAVEGPYFAWLVCQQGASPRSNIVYRVTLIRQLEQADADAKVRSTIGVAVVAGTLYTFERGQTATVPDGGIGRISPTSPYVNLAPLFRDLYVSDGYGYFKYNPDGFDESPRLDTFDTFQTKVGRLPEAARVFVPWRGRLVAGRFADDPHNWVMTKSGEPEDLNLFPVEPTVLDAVAGNFGGQGQIQEVMTAFLPFSEDYALCGTDGAVHLFQGDPADNGRIVRLTSSYGIAFGSGWAQDPQGVVYFQGNNGGIYAYPPGALPVKISERSIDAELEKIDLLTYKAGLVWNERQECLHVFLMQRKGISTSLADHWVWEKKRAWWKDRFLSTGLQPTSVALFDGDLPSDRAIVLGCEDGTMRMMDLGATSDDGHPIQANVTIGPIGIADPGMSSRVWGLQIALATEMSGCYYDWLVGDSPDNPDRVISGGFLRPGQNPIMHSRAKGNWVWLRLRSMSSTTRWAFEGANVMVTPTGRARVR